MMRRNKYNARKIVDESGNKFDSAKEWRRWVYLQELEENGEISELKKHWKFELIPHQLGEDGKVKELAVNYYADFVYKDAEGKLVVEDVKGDKHSKAYDLFVIKRKLMLLYHGIEIKEI